MCSRPTSRLFGLAAFVAIKTGTTRFPISVRGYCLEHRDQVVPTFVAECSAEGEILWQPDAPADLRPADAERFVRSADQMAVEIGEELGLDAGVVRRTLQEVENGIQCPHCGAEVAVGVGPHVPEAAERNALAWECARCGAAGLITSDT